MALIEQTISLSFGQGESTKTDPKMLSGKLELLQNGVFTKAMQVRKRNGYDSEKLDILTGGTISNPTMCKSYKNELLLAGTSPTTGKRIFSYSEELGKWIDKGKYVSAKVSKRIIAAPEYPYQTVNTGVLGVTNSNAAYLSGIAAFSFDQDIPNHQSNSPQAQPVYFSILDMESGTSIAPQTQISSAFGTTYGFSKIVSLGSSRFAIFYISYNGSAYNLCFKTITVSSGGISLGSETALNAVTNISGTQRFAYDVYTTSSGAIVALGNGSAVVLYTLDSSGSVTNGPTSISTTGQNSTISIQLDDTGTNAWIYFLDNGSAIEYAIYNATTLTQVLSKTSIATGLSSVRQITALATSSTEQNVYWSTITDPADSTLTIGLFYPTIHSSTADLSGTVGTPSIFKYGVDIYSRPFSVDGSDYLGCMALSQDNPIGIVLDLSDGACASRFFPGYAEGVYAPGYNTTGSTYTAGTELTFRWPSFICSPFYFSSTLIGFSSGFVVSLNGADPVTSSNNAAFPATVTLSALMGVALVSFDFDHEDAYQGVVQQDALLLNGGIVYQYDGASVTELQYAIDPDQVSVVGSSNMSASLGIGRYTVWIVFEWVDGNGNLVLSKTSSPVVINFTSGTTNRISVGWANLSITQKSNVIANIYCTDANGTIGYLYERQSNGSGWHNSTNIDSISTSNPQIYTEGGSILDNIAPPPSMIIWTNNNRPWCVDSENEETNIQYGKTASQGYGVSFSNGFLEYIIDSKGGAISGASPMDEKTVILKKSAVGFFQGDGLTDAGLNSTLTNFQFIPSDVGCSNSKSVILYPDGILFKSEKGIYKVNRGIQIQYFGYDVEDYNGQDITSAQILAAQTQIRFLTSSGSSILYDYFMNQWSVFTNHEGLSADIWGGLYVYVRSDGSVYLENDSNYLDDTTPYSLVAITAWIKANSIQNFQRLRRIEMLGDYSGASGHGIQVSSYWDWSASPSSVVPYSFDGSSSVYQYRERLNQQKGDAVQFKIEEITTGASGEYIDFSDLGLEIGAKKGLRKLPAAQSVG